MPGALLSLEEPLVLAGDFNVIPEPRDVHDPALWAQDALYLPQTRARFRTLLNLGLTDALRASTDAPGLYTFWDYQAGAWQKNNGIRIDHLLLSPQAADRLAVGCDRQIYARGGPALGPCPGAYRPRLTPRRRARMVPMMAQKDPAAPTRTQTSRRDCRRTRAASRSGASPIVAGLALAMLGGAPVDRLRNILFDEYQRLAPRQWSPDLPVQNRRHRR